MQQLLKQAAITAGQINSSSVHTEKSRTFGVQMVATPSSNAASQATGWLQASNDNKNWINLAKCDSTGNSEAQHSDGGAFEATWVYMRFRLETTTNCKVDVYLSKKEG